MSWTFRPANAVFGWLLAIAVGVPLALMAVLSATGEVPLTAPALLLGALVPLAFAAPIAWAIRRNEIRLSDDAVVVRSSFYRFRAAPSAIVPESIRRFDLRAEREWRPRFRTNGVALPGYRSGWFRLVNRQRAFLALAQGDGLRFVTREGVAVLVSPVEVEEVEGRLKALVGAR